MEQSHSNTEGNIGNRGPGPRVRMTLSARSLPRFTGLLSAGFFVRVKAGYSINELLNHEFGISEAYIDDRIQTIFLNGKAVDDSNTAMIRAGATLALSAAMPGMVGSTFRKGGSFAGMRSQISHVTDDAQGHNREIEVKLKLFNLIARELGPAFLERGVWIQGEHWQDFLAHNLEYLNQECKSVTLDGQEIELSKLSQSHFTSNRVKLSVETGPQSAN